MDVIELSDSEDTIILTPPNEDFLPKYEEIVFFNRGVSERSERRERLSDSEDDLPAYKQIRSPISQTSTDDQILDQLKKKYNKRTASEKEEIKQEKLNKRLKKKEEIAREKEIQKAQEANKKNTNRGECLKFITVQFDNSILKEPYAVTLTDALKTAEVNFHIEAQIFPNTVSWVREVQSHFMEDDGKLVSSTNKVQTDHVLLVVKCAEFLEMVTNNTLNTHIGTIRSVLCVRTILFLVYGMKEYFRYWRNNEQKEFRSQIVDQDASKLRKKHNILSRLPKVSAKDVEYALTDLQVTQNIAYRFVDSPVNFARILLQLTKAVAEIPFKSKLEEQLNNMDWFAPGENKNCVKVDKNGTGLKRLWTQSLTMFPLVRLETADAIAQQYPNPTLLFRAYSACSTENEKEKLLEDIQLKTAPGVVVTNARRIGPELSRKIYKFYNSLDGDTLL